MKRTVWLAALLAALLIVAGCAGGAPIAPVEVPEPLRGYEIDSARAADFDALLSGDLS